MTRDDEGICVPSSPKLQPQIKTPHTRTGGSPFSLPPLSRRPVGPLCAHFHPLRLRLKFLPLLLIILLLLLKPTFASADLLLPSLPSALRPLQFHTNVNDGSAVPHKRRSYRHCRHRFLLVFLQFPWLPPSTRCLPPSASSSHGSQALLVFEGRARRPWPQSRRDERESDRY